MFSSTEALPGKSWITFSPSFRYYCSTTKINVTLVNHRKYYVYTKASLPLDIEFTVQDIFALTRPQWKLASNLEEATKAFQLAVAQDQKTAGIDKTVDLDDVTSDPSSDDENVDGDEGDVDVEGDDESASEEEDAEVS